jgi:hypothetical protein
MGHLLDDTSGQQPTTEKTLFTTQSAVVGQPSADAVFPLT